MQFPELYAAAPLIEHFSSALGRNLSSVLQRASARGVFYLPPDQVAGLEQALRLVLEKSNLFSGKVIDQAGALIDQISSREEAKPKALLELLRIGTLLSTSNQASPASVHMVVSVVGLDREEAPFVECRQLPDPFGGPISLENFIRPRLNISLRDISFLVGNMLG